MTSAVHIRAEVLPLNKTFKADERDGKRGFSMEEALALEYLYEQFGDPLVYGELDWGLSSYMENRFNVYYQKLLDRKVRPQTVYIDFSPVEKYYNENRAKKLRMTFVQWQQMFFKKLAQNFVTEEGPLNIRFVTKKPEEPCIHMVFSSEPVYQTIAKRPDDEKLVFMKFLKSYSPVLIERKLAEESKVGSLKKTEEELLLKIFDDGEIAQMEDLFKVSGVTFNLNSLGNEFGNQDDASLIVMEGVNCGNMDPDVSASVAAHEIGHALGLQHPLSDLGRFSRESLDDELKLRCDIMSKHSYRDNPNCDPLKSGRFNDFALSYFSQILGVQSQ